MVIERGEFFGRCPCAGASPAPGSMRVFEDTGFILCARFWFLFFDGFFSTTEALTLLGGYFQIRGGL
jgi:hypothetical protein